MEAKKPRSYKYDELYAIILRMWVAGAIYFLMAMGTTIAEQDEYILPLIVTLAVVLFVVEWVMVDPMIKMMFKTRLNRQKLTYTQIPVYKKIIKNALLILLNIGIVTSVALLYYLLNQLFKIIGLGEPLSPEPFLFGIFYGMFYKIYELCGDVVYKYRLKSQKEA